jgi:hypothetical protein
MLSRSRFARLGRVSPATWLAWLLPIFVWAPLTYPGYFEFLNGFSPIFNLDNLLHGGQGLGWVPLFGQPYDMLRGEGPWPYVLAAPLRALGLPGVSAVKIVMFAAIMSGALGAYAWARRSLGPWPGLLASATYVFWPLGLATIYLRGAFAEAVFLGLLPLTCWAADAAREPKRVGARAGLALALAAAIWTQPGLALWLAPMLLAYILLVPLLSRGRQRVQAGALLAWLAGLLAGALGLLPAAVSHGSLGSGTYVNFSDHFVFPHQLLQAGWGIAPSLAGPYDTMPLQLGLVACGLAVVGVVLVSSGSEVRLRQHRDAPYADGAGGSTIWVPVALALFPVILGLSFAGPLWRALPFLSRTLTYPWQLLLLSGPWLAWLAGVGGLALASIVPAAIAARGVAQASAAAGEQDTAPVPADGARTSRPAHAVPLFAGLIVLALLGAYGDLNPPSTPAFVPERPVAVFGDNQVALLDAQVSGAPGPGNVVTIRARWQALRPLDRDYTVFVHAIGPDGAQSGQMDTMPRGNKFPTSQWRPGTVVDDEYRIALKPGAPAGTTYHFALGLYQYQTGQRLPVGAADQIVIDGTEPQ